MKPLILSLLLIFALSCDKSGEGCLDGFGTKISGEGMIVDHPGFSKLVIRYHIPGTIDSFHTYVPCNLPEELTEGMEIQFTGSVQKLSEKDEPLTQIAGEEFFVLFISNAKEAI